MDERDLQELQKQLNEIMNERNNKGRPDFEGYSPAEMQSILSVPFQEGSPLIINKVSEEVYARVPLLNQVKYLAGIVERAGEIKLTSRDYLPTQVTHELHHQGFIKDEFLEGRNLKMIKEKDSMAIELTHLLMDIMGMTKKRAGKWSLTRSGQKYLADDDALLRQLIIAFTTKFNWAYYDAYGENHIGQLGVGYTILLLGKYGHEKRMDSYYSGKYFTAFPRLLDDLVPSYGTVERYASRCYSIRTFDRFLGYLGLIHLEKIRVNYEEETYIRKSDIFDLLITCVPPGGVRKG